MARRQFDTHEAVSALVKKDDGYQAAIATKPLEGFAQPRFHGVLGEQRFATATEADQAASDVLDSLKDVDAEGELVF